jgi:hypothetical protein
MRTLQLDVTVLLYTHEVSDTCSSVAVYATRLRALYLFSPVALAIKEGTDTRCSCAQTAIEATQLCQLIDILVLAACL